MADQRWEFAEFPCPNGAELLVQFLNATDRQGWGEASATLRNDGTAGLIYLTPGSLGASISPTWILKQLPGPDGAQAAVQLLNGADRQGPGEASVTARSDGTAGLIFLGPGSLGTSTEPTWVTREFNGPNGAQDAVDFLNAWPQQPGPGEAVAWLPGSGAVIFYLTGPTGIVHP